MNIRLAVAMLTLSLSAQAADEQSHQFGPETFVTFPEGAVACLTKDDLQTITTHFIKGETTKGNAMLNSKQNPDGNCVSLVPEEPFKILSSEYNDPDHPDMGLIEVVGKDSKSAEGAWTFSMFAQQAKPKPKVKK